MLKKISGSSLFAAVLSAVLFAATAAAVNAAVQRTITGPAGSVKFGASVAVLPNGNVVVVDPEWSGSRGAIYLYNGKTGAMISQAVGAGGARIGDYGIQVTPRGDFFVCSPHWGGDRGAITFGDKDTGVSGDVGPANSLVSDAINDLFGYQFVYHPLPGGNYVIGHYRWNQSRGSSTLITSSTGVNGTISAANSLVGVTPGDSIGVTTVPLENSHYAVMSYQFNGSRGSFSLCGAATGCAGQVSASNSFIGSDPSMRVGADWPVRLATGNYVLPSANAATFFRLQDGLTGSPSTSVSLVATINSVSNVKVYALPTGNYLVGIPGWNSIRGAIAFGSGTTGLTGTVSAANSLVGATSGDIVGEYVTVLPNGNYVTYTPNWDNGAQVDAGAATFGSGATGITGEVSAANSLVGDATDDEVGYGGVSVLANGNYVVSGWKWKQDRGSVTFGSGTAGVTGVVSAANSLVGTTAGDRVGYGGAFLVPLPNGDYLQGAPEWDNSAALNVGAVTRCSGSTGCSGTISPANSYVGVNTGDRIGSQNITALPNGNIVINSPNWNGGRGASTWIDGAQPFAGVVTAANSLTGDSTSDFVGGGKTIVLSTGNYLVVSPSYDNGAADTSGAVTFVNAATGVTGVLSAANSLVGTFSGDHVGQRDLAVFPNGNYYVGSSDWNNGRGALTFGSGTAGVAGEISAANSLVGGKPGDSIGFITQMYGGTGEYYSASGGWDNGSIVDAGAVTYLTGKGLPTGEVSAKTSVVGTAAGQNVGAIIGNQGLPATVFPDGSFYFKSKGASGAGTVSLFRRGSALVGSVAYHNSVIARSGETPANLSVSYNPAANRMAVGQPFNKIVTILKKDTPFDFDGDDRAEISYFRAGAGSWRYLQSTDGTEGGADFGQSGDRIVPADYTGDSKADVAVFRPSTGAWYVLRSDTATVDTQFFGLASDVVVPGDYDADGRADVAVFRPATGNWFINRSAAGLTVAQFGASGDVPLARDYDADGLTDIAIFRPNAATGNGEWWIQRSTAGLFVTVFGTNADQPLPADYSGDGTVDIAVRRLSDGYWYVLQMEDFNYFAGPFGAGADKAVPADYDGDGKTDFAVFRPSESNWYTLNTTGGVAIRSYGSATDTPVPTAY